MDESGKSPGDISGRPVRRARLEWFGLAAVLVVSVVGVGAALAAKQRGNALPPTPTLAVVRVPGVTTRLVVPHQSLPAGSSMHASVVVTNTTGHPIKSVKCFGPFAVDLRNRHAFQAPAFALCAVDFTFPIGRSTYPVTIDSSYGHCTHDGGSPDRSMPKCSGDGKPLPLPKGKYQAFVVGQEEVVSSAVPVAIEVD